jgi:hypothetical protein
MRTPTPLATKVESSSAAVNASSKTLFMLLARSLFVKKIKCSP